MAAETGELKNEDHNDVAKHMGLGVRHIQMGMMTLCATVLFIMRSSMGVAILAMTDTSRINATDSEIYDWNSETSGLVLSSFFWGYTLMQIPGGILSKIYGGKLLLCQALVINGLLCLATPTLTKFGSWKAVCFVRVCMGFSQACFMPATHTLLGTWAPIQERTRFSVFAYAGVQLGTIISMPLCGLLSNNEMGWKLIFYAMGGLSLVTAILWWLLTASSPPQHRLISKKEIEYIESSLEVKKEGKLVIPLKEILTSIPMWAILCAQVGSVWYFTIFFVEIPTYLKTILKMDTASGSMISAFPYLAQWMIAIACSCFGDYLFNNKILSLTHSRKLFNTIGCVLGFIGTLSLSFINSEYKITTIVLLAFTNGIISATNCGFMLNPIDLSPRFGGIIYGFTSAIANLTGLMGPISAGYILGDDPTDASRWRIVFCMAGGLALASDIVYRLFATSEKQAWDDPDYTRHKYKSGTLITESVHLKKEEVENVYKFQDMTVTVK